MAKKIKYGGPSPLKRWVSIFLLVITLATFVLWVFRVIGHLAFWIIMLLMAAAVFIFLPMIDKENKEK